ncbi:MAG TPA: hypothetical protein DDW65_25035 [Firmicutes bacterium]|jgi:hypothetical protein|nr:hypothetical protein [Bacillota bacterium]
MNDSATPKTLLMQVKKKWLVETITSLGSGYQTHLAYKNEWIDPKVLADIKSKQWEPKVLGAIVFQDQNTYHRIAEVELMEVNDFDTFVRFDLRLLEVVPFIRGKWSDSGSSYLCYYQKHSA